MRTTGIVIFFISVISFGCQLNEHKYYSVRFENNTNKEIEIIEMRTDSGAYAVSGLLSPGKSSVNGLNFRYPANDVYKINWRFAGSQMRHKTFDLRNSISDDFKGHIVFSLNRNDELEFYQWLSPFQYDYTIELVNSTDDDIYKPFIKSSNGSLSIMYKSKLEAKEKIRIWDMKSFPANAIYTIDWQVKNGETCSENYDFRKDLKESFSGIIRFIVVEPHKVEYQISHR